MYLGWSEGFHDAAASVINKNGDIVFASHSERFSGNKHEKYISSELKDYIDSNFNIKTTALFEKPFLKKTRQLYAGQFNTVFSKRQLAWSPDKTFHHHKSHAAATFQTSDYNEAAAVVVDSIGEWDTTTIWKCSYDDNGYAQYKKVYTKSYPNSIGLWYTALTHFVGLRPLDEEYIFMGMAAFGKYKKDLLPKLFSLFSHNLHKGIPKSMVDAMGLDRYKPADIAFNAQIILENKLEGLFNKALEISDNVVYGGGVALNCVANSKLHKQCKGNLWIFPNPGDAGGSLGAAALAYGKKVNWEHPYLGFNIEPSKPIKALAKEIVIHIKKYGMCGVAVGPAEFGPRALGNRSLLADPRGAKAQDQVNTIKRRQKFRPFAPAVLEEDVNLHFKPGYISPYMQMVVDCTDPNLPAITHKDGTSRIQTVSKNEPTIFRAILEEWKKRTGCSVLLNTSLNIRGEPMVNNISDADRFEEKYGVKVFY